MLLQSHVPGYIIILPSLPASLSNAGGIVVDMRARGGIQVSFAWTKAAKKASTIRKKQPQDLTSLLSSKSKAGKVYALRLRMRKYHPWYGTSQVDPPYNSIGGLRETSPGYFTWTDTSNEYASFLVVLPYSTKEMKLVRSSSSSEPEIPAAGTSSQNGGVWRTMKATAKDANSQCARIITDPATISAISWSRQPYHAPMPSASSEPQYSEIYVQIRSYPCELLLCWDFAKLGLSDADCNSVFLSS
jgi:hypothetical protein